MSKIQFEYEVELADGTIEKVVADQRDLARWEVQDFAAAGRFHLQVRFLAWSALKREGRYTTTFEKFNQLDCIEVVSPGADEEDEEGGQSLDPGLPAPAAGS